MLTKRQALLRLDGPEPQFAGFRFVDEAGETGALLGWSAWRDMGEPNEVTVTIEQGDRLNT